MPCLHSFSIFFFHLRKKKNSNQCGLWYCLVFCTCSVSSNSQKLIEQAEEVKWQERKKKHAKETKSHAMIPKTTTLIRPKALKIINALLFCMLTILSMLKVVTFNRITQFQVKMFEDLSDFFAHSNKSSHFAFWVDSPINGIIYRFLCGILVYILFFIHPISFVIKGGFE